MLLFRNGKLSKDKYVFRITFTGGYSRAVTCEELHIRRLAQGEHDAQNVEAYHFEKCKKWLDRTHSMIAQSSRNYEK